MVMLCNDGCGCYHALAESETGYLDDLEQRVEVEFWRETVYDGEQFVLVGSESGTMSDVEQHGEAETEIESGSALVGCEKAIVNVNANAKEISTSIRTLNGCLDGHGQQRV
jgi:hypothetical protein